MSDFQCSKCVFNKIANKVYSKCLNMQANPTIVKRNAEFGTWPINFYSEAISSCDGFSTNKEDLNKADELLKMFLIT